jgi:NAD(P)-dependent dehydrogenase (short-subunit alcohol dehydrogenase family)
VKPDLKIVRVNLDGSLYTWKLAVHYFRKQPDTEDRDRCFIITGSMVAYIDSPVSDILPVAFHPVGSDSLTHSVSLYCCWWLTRVSQGNWEYTATKYALRGFMKTARRNSHEQAIRISYVAPCWIRSAIRTAEYEKWLVDRGIEFGEQKDVASCMMRIACDKSITGMFGLLKNLYLCPIEHAFLPSILS